MEIQTGATTGREFPRKIMSADVVVVGGGPAGFFAALAAARTGAATVLATDRPVLGGNSSSEVQVILSGAGHRNWGRYSQETGLLEEYFCQMMHRTSFIGNWNWTASEQVMFDMAQAQPNLRLLMNTTIDRALCDRPGHIRSAEGVQLRAETRWELHAPYFVDATGDGTLGFLAGADYRMGRESKAEFGEPSAPDQADRITMGATVMFRSVDRGRPVPFKAPPGAIAITNPDALPYYGKKFSRNPKGEFGYFWWAEIGGLIDPIHDDQEVQRQCRMLVYGLWDYIKNSGQFENVAHLDLDWIAPLAGKRESRRLTGPVLLTENTFKNQQRFEDAVAHCGYMIDVHPPGGYLNPDWGVTHNYQPGPSDVPLRSLFSRNIENLLFAGRNASATHQGIGSLRVAGTCAVTGQAAGCAAALCASRSLPPAQLARQHAPELQRTLLRADQTILGRTLREHDDLSRSATVSASSTRRFELLGGDLWLDLDRRRGLVVPVATDTLDTVELFLRGPAGAAITADVLTCDRPENYRMQTLLTTVTANLDGEGWTPFKCNVRVGPGRKVFFILRPCEGAATLAQRTHLTGALALDVGLPETLDFDTPYKWSEETPCFRLTPYQDLFAATCVNDGHIRPYALPHAWASGPMAPGREEWVEYAFDRPRTIARVELVFNTDLNKDHMFVRQPPPTLVKAYSLEGRCNGQTNTLASETENIQRLRCHNFPPQQADAIRLRIAQTWGHPHAEVFDFRVYG